MTDKTTFPNGTSPRDWNAVAQGLENQGMALKVDMENLLEVLEEYPELCWLYGHYAMLLNQINVARRTIQDIVSRVTDGDG